jgi:hypothetical protein
MKSRVILGLVLVLSLLLGGTAMAAPVNPTTYNDWQSGNAEFECRQVGCSSEFHYKFDNWSTAYNGSYTVEGGNVITIQNNTGKTFDWESAWPVACVIVKGGPSANVYCYGSGSRADTGMYAPNNKEISHVTFCYNRPSMCYKQETAWGRGERYVKRGNWAMYVQYVGEEKTVDLIAGQHYTVGTVTFSAPDDDDKVTITVSLTGGAIFYDDPNDPGDNNLKVQDYAEAPTGNPAPGQFALKTWIDPSSTTGSIVVPHNNYYGVHVDVALPVPCQ